MCVTMNYDKIDNYVNYSCYQELSYNYNQFTICYFELLLLLLVFLFFLILFFIQIIFFGLQKLKKILNTFK